METQQQVAKSIESAKRLIVLADYRLEQEEYYEAIDVLKQALLFIGPKNLKTQSEQITAQVRQLKIEIDIKLCQLFMIVNKNNAASEYIRSVLEMQRTHPKALELQAKLNGHPQFEFQTKLVV